MTPLVIVVDADAAVPTTPDYAAASAAVERRTSPAADAASSVPLVTSEGAASPFSSRL